MLHQANIEETSRSILDKKKNLSHVNSSLMDGEANHKFTAESVPELCNNVYLSKAK